MKPMRGQAAVEFLSIVGIQLLVLAAAWLYFSSNYSTAVEQLDAAKARDSVEKISDTAQVVSLQGHPAKQTIIVDFPAGITAVNVTGHEVRLALGDGKEAYSYSPALLAGSVSPIAGTKYIVVEALANNSVRVTG